jgi:L-ascorbate metabolism protein UlaG (beta-lactamase superfamily)
MYIDPRNLSGSAHDAALVLVSHSHSDHYSPTDIAKIWGPQTQLIAPADVIAKEPQERKDRAILLLPGQTIQAGGVLITGVAAYNANHPKTNNWLGFIIDPVRKDSSFVVPSGLRSRYGGVGTTEKESRFSNGVEIGLMRIYDAGDTGLTDEMKALRNIEVALLPIDGVYTMSAEQAAQATTHIQPKLAIPDHWGDIVGTRADAERFASLAQCDVKIMDVGETISSVGWLKDFPLISYWQLDETEGTTAYDIAGENDGTVNGGAIWQPTGGIVNGALQLDGTNDYVSTPFVLNPSSGQFSALAWVKGGSPGQVVVSQQSSMLTPRGKDWLCADPLQGRLMTALTDGSPSTSPLVCEFVITDGDWHYIAVTWDGSRRRLYADGIKVAEDSGPLANLVSSDKGLYLGAGKTLTAGTFWLGLIDDIRIYDNAITP